MPSLSNLNLKSNRSIANFKNTTQLTSSVIMNSDLDPTPQNFNMSPMSKSKMNTTLNQDLDHDFSRSEADKKKMALISKQKLIEKMNKKLGKQPNMTEKAMQSI